MSELTSRQREAVAARGNLLIVAGAGTGKTRTLIARCLRLVVEENVSLENILMVTFTEAAAAEMRARIREELGELQAARPDHEHLAQQLALLDNARICTMHSFCLQLVREHFHELGLDPQFTVLDEQQTRPLMRTTLDELFERHYSGGDAASQAVRALIRVLGRGADQRIRKLVLKLHKYSQSLPDPPRWLDEEQRRFQPAEPAQWREAFLAAVAAWREEWKEVIGPFAGRAPAVQLSLDALERLPENISWESASTALRAVQEANTDVNWPRGSKKNVRDPLKNFFDDAAFLGSLLPDGQGKDPLAQDWEWTRHHLTALVSLTREFASEYGRAKRELGGLDFADLEQCALRLLSDPVVAAQCHAQLPHVFVDEYQDINEAQDKIITKVSGAKEEVSGVRCEVSGGFRPESHFAPNLTPDTSHLTPPSGPSHLAPSRFLVGDVKQSIYRFRLANPKIFQRYKEDWSARLESGGPAPSAGRGAPAGQTISLSENFRSRAALLDFINPLFAGLMRRAVGGVDYEELEFGEPDGRSALQAKAGDAPCVEFHLIARAEDEADNAGPDEDDGGVRPAADLLAIEREARLLARRLRDLKESGHPVWDDRENRFRPVQWSDMAVLLRSPSGRAEAFAMEFDDAGVPLAAARDGFFESLEISDLLNLLKLLDNPLQDVPLLAVLRSPLVGMSLDDLAEARGHTDEQPFWTALAMFHRETAKQNSSDRTPSAAPRNGTRKRGEEMFSDLPLFAPVNRGENETKTSDGNGDGHVSGAWAKADLFLQQFARWRELVRQTSLSHCLETALAETHYVALLLAGKRGSERAANVRRLLDLARQFDPYQRQGLYRFLRFVAAQQEDEFDLQPAAPPAADAVRLMSIHKSKGLEFPIVALACLGTRFNEQDLNEQVLLNEQYGLCPKIIPPDKEQSYQSLTHWLGRRAERRELRGEELRLFYVALTRARDALILVGADNRKTARVKWEAEPKQPDLAPDFTPATLSADDDEADEKAAPESPNCTTTKKREVSSVGGSISTSDVVTARSQLDWLLAWLPSVTTKDDWRDDANGQSQILRWRIYDEHDPVFAARAPRPEGGGQKSEVGNPKTEEKPVERMKAMLAWQYPFASATTEPAKSSVSALRRRQRDETDDEARPLFQFKVARGIGRAGVLSAAEIGNAHHRFLQLAALDKLGEAADSKSEAERLRDAGLLSAEEFEALDMNALAGFWQSKTGKRILERRASVHREIPFTARFSAADLADAGLTVNIAEGEFVVVQGVADLAVILPAEIWLVDFKTDDVKGAELKNRVKSYEPQLRLYARALSGIYQRPVTECCIHFLAGQMTVPIKV